MRAIFLSVAEWLMRKHREAAAEVIRKELAHEPWPRKEFYVRMQKMTGLDRAEVIHITNHYLIYGNRNRRL